MESILAVGRISIARLAPMCCTAYAPGGAPLHPTACGPCHCHVRGASLSSHSARIASLGFPGAARAPVDPGVARGMKRSRLALGRASILFSYDPSSSRLVVALTSGKGGPFAPGQGTVDGNYFASWEDNDSAPCSHLQHCMCTWLPPPMHPRAMLQLAKLIP